MSDLNAWYGKSDKIAAIWVRGEEGEPFCLGYCASPPVIPPPEPGELCLGSIVPLRDKGPGTWPWRRWWEVGR